MTSLNTIPEGGSSDATLMTKHDMKEVRAGDSIFNFNVESEDSTRDSQGTDGADDNSTIDSALPRRLSGDSLSEMSCSETESSSHVSHGGGDAGSSVLFRRTDLKISSQSATLLVNEQSKCKEANGETVYKFGFGQSPFLPPDHIMDELTKHVARKEYLQVQGLPALCEKVAKFHNHYDHLNIKGENVLIGNGSKMLIYAILNSFRQANVFLVTPCWVSYEPQADLAKLNTVRIETTYEEGWRLTPARLRKSLAHYSSDATPSICIFNFPGNPDGLSYTDSEVRALAAVFREFNVLVISDEIYGLLDHTGSHISMARYYSEGTIVTSGLSKWCGAGGWRVGVALFPTSLEATLKPVVVGILSETISCVSAPIQYAAVVAYTLDPRVDAYLAHQRRILSLAGGMFHERLTKVGIRFVKPTGGFYLYIDFTPLAKILVDRRGISTSYDLATDLLCRAGIAILPGNAFGVPTHVMSARLAYVDFNGAAAMTASTAIGLDTALTEDFLEEHTPKLVAGCDAIIKYCTDLVHEVPLAF